MEVGGGGRRRHSLSDENIDSSSLNEDGHSTVQTLASVLSQKRQPEAANRTLLDIIRDDPSGTHHRKTWRTFKDKIRLRRAGAAWTSSVHVPTSDVPMPSANRMMSRRQSTRFPTTDVADDPEDQIPQNNRPGIDSMPSNRAMMMRHNSSRLPNLATTSYGRGVEFSTSFKTNQDRVRVSELNDNEEEDEEEEEESEEDDSTEPQVRMSLMALLAETDRQMGLNGSPFMMGDDEDEEDEDEEEMSSGVGEYNNCCVCMVRHKGAAFIPCGHTFCRLCSRELWVQRGNCPLCNNFIREILDIF